MLPEGARSEAGVARPSRNLEGPGPLNGEP